VIQHKVGARPGSRWGIHTSVRVFDSLKDAMAVYDGSERKGGKREYCETGSRWVSGVMCTRAILAATRICHDMRSDQSRRISRNT